MKIILKTTGDLQDYFGRQTQKIEFPEGPVVQDLTSWAGWR
jgi:hypothetical protein